jgi:hypothetical protein
MRWRSEAISMSGGDYMGRLPESSEITIAPNGFLSVPFVIALDGKFFESDGYYRLLVETSVNARDGSKLAESSNELLFELKSCD